MTTPKSTPHDTMLEELRTWASSIYGSWADGGAQTAKAMLAQVPAERQGYVIMTGTIIAINEGNQYRWTQFIAEVTQ